MNLGFGSSSTSQNGVQDTSGSGVNITSLLFDPAMRKQLDDAFADSSYSKDAAIADSKASADFVMQSLLEKNAPEISSQAKAAGGYNSTEQARQGKDLTARVGAAGQQVLLDTITKYAGIKQGNIQAATGAVAATTGKKEDMTQTSHTTSQQGSSEKSAGAKTVICTQLFCDGHISADDYLATSLHSRTVYSADTINGYHFYAVPFVLLMRRNTIAYSIGHYIGTRYAAAACGRSSSLLVSLLQHPVTALCYITGRIVGAVSVNDRLYHGL